MIILTVFVQVLEKIKRKTSSQYNEENEYTDKSDGSFPNLPLPNRPFPKPLVLQI